MKKSLILIAACAMSVSVMSGSVFAKSERADGEHGNADKKAEAQLNVQSDVQANVQTEAQANAQVKANSQATVTSTTYEENGHQGYKGLLNAIENVKDKPAGAVIADQLLTKYSVHLSDDQKAELQSIEDKAQALSAAADVLAEDGKTDDAVTAEKAAVQLDVKNLDLYKKLGKLYEKTGKVGVKLYVNGEEPAFEVPPFIRDGSTLVPFRAISEALKATVSWNPDERSVTVERGDVTVKLYIDSKIAYVNGEEVTLEVPAAIEDGSTVVPARFVSEALKAEVQWEAETQSVVITQ